MTKLTTIVFSAVVLGLSACTEHEQQQAAEDMSYKQAREQAEAVEQMLQDKVQADREALDNMDKAPEEPQ